MEERRQLFNDPEFPFWTSEPSRGHVALIDGVAHVVYDIKRDGAYQTVLCRKLSPDGTDDLNNVTNCFWINTPAESNAKIKIVDRMYFHGEDKPYQVNLIDNEPLYFLSKPLAHEDVLPPDHPLRHIPYWGAPGGKNLTIIACLEWALMHLEFEDKKLPCVENEETLKSLKWAICLQKMRQQTRLEQGVLGTNKPHVSDDIAIKLPKMKM
jgi:hypothetical protein